MTTQTTSRLKSELQLLAVVLFWGLNFPVAKWVLIVIHPHVMNLFRLLAAALVLGVFYYRSTKRAGIRFWDPIRTDFKSFVFISLLGWVAYQIAFITGLDLTTAGNSAIIMSSAPVWTMIVALIWRIEKITLLAALGMLISLVGTSWIILADGNVAVDSTFFLGNVVILGAAMLWGAYTAYTRPLVQRHSPLALTVLSVLLALPILTVIAIPYCDETAWESVTLLHWVAMFFSGSLSTGLAIVFWNNAVRNLGASHTAAFGNLVPLIALFSGFLLLGDPILPVQLIGGTLVIGGLVIMRWARKSRVQK